MRKIGIISDTHSYLDPQVLEHFADRDELWHIGDFGSLELVEQLQKFKPLKGVYGNIDGLRIREAMPLENVFLCEEVKVFMTHIGGYPTKYEKGVKSRLVDEKPLLFLSGHSHILKVMWDDDLKLLHINPGAAGHEGFHKIRTIIKLDIEGLQINRPTIIELGKRDFYGQKR